MMASTVIAGAGACLHAFAELVGTYGEDAV